MNTNWLTKLNGSVRRLFHQPIRLSYGITVCNEATELDRLLQFLFRHKDPLDEVLVLHDVTILDEGVEQVLRTYQNQVTLQKGMLKGDFASFKNQLLSMARGHYLFQIDADEVPHPTLIATLKDHVRANHKADCFAVPRVNRVDGITEEFIDQYQWHLDEKKRINFPDYQVRVFRLNAGIHWKNKVHEELTGFKQMHYLPAIDENFCLFHLKDMARQKRQNEFYASFQHTTDVEK